MTGSSHDKVLGPGPLRPKTPILSTSMTQRRPSTDSLARPASANDSVSVTLSQAIAGGCFTPKSSPGDSTGADPLPADGPSTTDSGYASLVNSPGKTAV